MCKQILSRVSSDAIIGRLGKHKEGPRAFLFAWLTADSEVRSVLRIQALALLMSWLFVPFTVLQGAVPQVQNIRYSSLTHASIRWLFKAPKGSYAWIRYGTASGSYPYNSPVFAITEAEGKAALAIGGLEPDTTYYFRIYVRPNANDMNQLCDSDACGSVEQVVRTPPEPPIHPEMPEPPKAYLPSLPDTSSYVVIPMKVGPTGECIAAAAVADRNVNENDSIRTILSRISFGTVIEFPQGAECKVYAKTQYEPAYSLPAKAIDPPAAGDIDSSSHRWIVWRTASTSDADFPPFGSRTNPSWAPKLAKLVAQIPSTVVGQVIGAGSDGPHHYWFENIEITHAQGELNDDVDPRHFETLFHVTGQYSTPEQQPKYIVLDRVYLHGRGYPSRTRYGVAFGGVNQAMIGCYMDRIESWRIAKWPTSPPTVSPDGRTLSIPKSTYQRNIKDTPTGMNGPATAQLSAPADYTGTITGYINGNGLTIVYTPGNAEISCSNCDAVQNANMTVPSNAYNFFSGTVSNGRFAITNSNISEWQTGGPTVTMGITLADRGPGPYLFSNNHIEAYYMGFYIDGGWAETSIDDVLWVRNHMIWNQDHRPNSPTWNGFRYDARQLWEIKRGKRYLLSGNLFQGNWSFQNNGPAIFLSGRPTYAVDTVNTGISDIHITNNIIRHTSYGWACMGASTPPPDPPVVNRVLFENNLLYDINRYVYDDSGPSFASGYMETFPGCQDVTVRNNTMGLALGRGPYLMLIGGGHTFGEGLSVTDNIMYLSVGEGGGGIGLDDNQYLPITRRQPTVSGSTIKAKLDTFFVRNGQTQTPSYTWTNNVIIGGKTGTSHANLRDLSQSEVDSWAAQFPPGNFFPRGGNLTSREQMVFESVTDYKLNRNSAFVRGAATPSISGRSIGVDRTELESAMGLVQGISVQASSTSALLTYTAPDGNGCAADVSQDGSQWTRLFDSGGPRLRVIQADSLTPSSQYEYRILCYYEQRYDGALYTEYKQDQITRGSFTTQATVAGTGPIPLRFSVKAGNRIQTSNVLVSFTSSPKQTQSWVQSPLIRCADGCSLLLHRPPSSGPLFLKWQYYGATGQQQGSSRLMPSTGR
jgi:hypothetical protein